MTATTEHPDYPSKYFDADGNLKRPAFIADAVYDRATAECPTWCHEHGQADHWPPFSLCMSDLDRDNIIPLSRNGTQEADPDNLEDRRPSSIEAYLGVDHDDTTGATSQHHVVLQVDENGPTIKMTVDEAKRLAHRVFDLVITDHAETGRAAVV